MPYHTGDGALRQFTHGSVGVVSETPSMTGYSLATPGGACDRRRQSFTARSLASEE